MLLRKINAVISLLCTILLMDHAIFHAAWMLSRGSIAQSATPLPRMMFVVMMVHAVLSIVLAIRGHKLLTTIHFSNNLTSPWKEVILHF